MELKVGISQKQKATNDINIKSVFLRNDSSIHTLDIELDNIKTLLGAIHPHKKLKIKLEVDVNPPLRFQTEAKIILLPVTFNVVSMTLPNLYAGKMHAVLCRNWKNRVKGRDWFDFEWYVKQNAKLNLEHLQERMYESGHLQKYSILNQALFIQKMNDRIDALNIEKAKRGKFALF